METLERKTIARKSPPLNYWILTAFSWLFLLTAIGTSVQRINDLWQAVGARMSLSTFVINFDRTILGQLTFIASALIAVLLVQCFQRIDRAAVKLVPEFVEPAMQNLPLLVPLCIPGGLLFILAMAGASGADIRSQESIALVFAAGAVFFCAGFGAAELNRFYVRLIRIGEMRNGGNFRQSAKAVTFFTILAGALIVWPFFQTAREHGKTYFDSVRTVERSALPLGSIAVVFLCRRAAMMHSAWLRTDPKDGWHWTRRLHSIATMICGAAMLACLITWFTLAGYQHLGEFPDTDFFFMMCFIIALVCWTNSMSASTRNSGIESSSDQHAENHGWGRVFIFIIMGIALINFASTIHFRWQAVFDEKKWEHIALRTSFAILDIVVDSLLLFWGALMLRFYQRFALEMEQAAESATGVN